ncbi:MAG: CBS domain-containing protein [Nitrospinota bacterium]|nr:CBS domain-containing protein [Nitrospinota bacterium]MDH5679036.1 CBS domain-containing protein [Nitrospinota bacterium]
MPNASDIMTKDPFTVSPQTSVRDLALLLAEKNYSGAPVLDQDGKLVGVVTSSDLIYQRKKLHMPTVFTLFDAIIPLGGLHEVDEQMEKMLGRNVADIMSPNPVTVTEQTSMEDIATIMTEGHKHMIPVMRGDKLVGVVDRWDVLRTIVREEKE